MAPASNKGGFSVSLCSRAIHRAGLKGYFWEILRAGR